MGSVRSPAIAAFVSCALLAGCSSSSGGPSALVPGKPPPPNTTGYRALYNFHVTPGDGIAPYAALIDVGGSLYGTTSAGGSGSGCGMGCGTVFRVSTSGSERVIYDFGSYKYDGLHPYFGLTNVNGTLYGTTSAGGFGRRCTLKGGCGTVFSIDPAGTEHVLYGFGGHPHDGVTPGSNVIEMRGRLFGTTQAGGEYDDGSVFNVAASGPETVVYDFGSYPHDGHNPIGTLIEAGGSLYGVAERGGTFGHGAIFNVLPNGEEQLVHSFGGPPDGEDPRSGLLSVNGVLYGTTYAGGRYGGGTVFSYTTGAESVLHSFGSGRDGKNPEAELVAVAGTLYGTTVRGGARSYGTIFSVSKKGSEHVVYSFDGAQGAYPFGGLLEMNGALFGTSAYGGAGSVCEFGGLPGCGTVFEFK